MRKGDKQSLKKDQIFGPVFPSTSPSTSPQIAKLVGQP
jgi:hypothetical protein